MFKNKAEKKRATNELFEGNKGPLTVVYDGSESDGNKKYQKDITITFEADRTYESNDSLESTYNSLRCKEEIVMANSLLLERFMNGLKDGDFHSVTLKFLYVYEDILATPVRTFYNDNNTEWTIYLEILKTLTNPPSFPQPQ